MEFNKDMIDIQTEQNKNYNSSFSINSDEIKNSLRIFLDTWRRVEYDENMTFVFYTNTSIVKEKKVGLIKDLDLKLPKEPVLQLLIVISIIIRNIIIKKHLIMMLNFMKN